MHLILTGATGLLGAAVLRTLLNDAAVTKITILARRSVPLADGHSKADILILPDFADLSSPTLKSALSSATGVIWALGVSQTQVSKEEYRKITHDYALNFARCWAETPLPQSEDQGETGAVTKQRNFVFVSGESATHSPGATTAFYGKVKGQTEQDLLDLTRSPVLAHEAPLIVYCPRPGAVDPSAQKDIHAYLPKRPGLLGTIYYPTLRVLHTVYPAMTSPTIQLSEVLIKMAKGEFAEGLNSEGSDDAEKSIKMSETMKEGWIGAVVSNKELRRLGGL